MKKISSLVMVLILLLSISVTARVAKLDDTTGGCIGTDCEEINGIEGTAILDDCASKLQLYVDLADLYVDGDLGQSNYQLTLQTYSGDTSLDSTGVCDNPNGPMGGSHPNAWECGSWADYSFFNFEMDALTTDGNFEKSYEIELPEGSYDVALLVKHDKTPEGTGGASYPIVLQKDHIKFTISDDCIALLKGEKGDKGDQGEPGVQGEQGDVGEIGPQGGQGIPGIDGTDGEDGAVGLQGEIGEKGDTGETGLQGLKGEQGIQGIQGEHGVQGEIGQKGDTGADGVCSEQCADVVALQNGLFQFYPEFAIWWYSPKECIIGQTKCEGSDRYTCVAYAWNKAETCAYGCASGTCNTTPKENCYNKAIEYYCNGNYSIGKDYYACQSGHGTASSCDVGYCSFHIYSLRYYCGYKGCNTATGKCN